MGDHYRVYIRRGKGGKSRAIDVGKNVGIAEPIFKYLDARGAIKGAYPVFVSEKKGYGKYREDDRITKTTIWTRLKYYSNKIGINIHPHGCRHSFSIFCNEGGCDLNELRKTLGHSSLTTTQIYISRINQGRNRTTDYLPVLN